MSDPPLLTDAQRRIRIAVRHRLAPPHRAASVEAVTAAMVALHATEPATVYLSAAVRGECSVDDVDRALYTDRTVVKQLAMRRTLFGFTRDLLPAALGSSAARVAEQQRRLIAKTAQDAGIATDGPRWLEVARAAVLDRLAGGEALSATELREQVPELAGQLTFSVGKTYGGTINIAPRVLTVLGAEGLIMRADNAGHWRTSRPRWIATEAWLGEVPEPLPEDEGYAVLVSRWLRTFGPGTENDIVWWLGATRTVVRRALADVGAVEVRLEDGRPAWVAADDVEEVPDPGPWAALLPVLDATAMGWKEREFYLAAADVPYLVDTNGNIGTTAWWCGRVVGGWVQDDDGAVRVVLRSNPGSTAVAALEAEAARLTRWFDGVVVSSVYKSHLMKGEKQP